MVAYVEQKEFERETGFSVIGIPATIENDIWGTDYAIGTDTAVNTIFTGNQRKFVILQKAHLVHLLLMQS
mgnify:CR=1 FL=1